MQRNMPYQQQFNQVQEQPMNPQQYQMWYMQQPAREQLATPQQYQAWYIQQCNQPMQQQPMMPMQQPMQQPMHYRTPPMNNSQQQPMRPMHGFGEPVPPNNMDVSSGGSARSKRTRATTFVEPRRSANHRMPNHNAEVIDTVNKPNVLLEPGVEAIVAYTENNDIINIYKGDTTMTRGSNETQLDGSGVEYDVPVADTGIIGDYAYTKLLVSLIGNECSVAYAKYTTGYHFPKESNLVPGGRKCISESVTSVTGSLYVNKRMTGYINTALMLLNDDISIDDIVDDSNDLIGLIRDEYSASMSEYIECLISNILTQVKAVDTATDSDTIETITIPEIYMVFKTTDAMNIALGADEIILTDESAPAIMESINFINSTYSKHIMYLLTDTCKYYACVSGDGKTAALRKVTK